MSGGIKKSKQSMCRSPFPRLRGADRCGSGSGGAAEAAPAAEAAAAVAVAVAERTEPATESAWRAGIVGIGIDIFN